MRMYKKKTGGKTVTVTKKLLGATKVKKDPFVFMICWYLQHNLRLTTVNQLVEYD